MNMKVIYGKHDAKGRVSVARVEVMNLSHAEALRMSKFENIAAITAQETMKARMVYVNGLLTQV